MLLQILQSLAEWSSGSHTGTSTPHPNLLIQLDRVFEQTKIALQAFKSTHKTSWVAFSEAVHGVIVSEDRGPAATEHLQTLEKLARVELTDLA